MYTKQAEPVKAGVGSLVLQVILLLVVVGGSFTLTHRLIHLTVVHGISMNPTYVSGDLVLAVPASSYQVGDVISYHPKDLPCSLCNVIHRIVKKQGNRWVTKGDNNPNIDPWRPTASEINGKVILHVPVPPFLQNLYNVNFWLFLVLGGVAFYLVSLMKKDGEEAEVSKDQETPEPSPTLPRVSRKHRKVDSFDILKYKMMLEAEIAWNSWLKLLPDNSNL